MTTAQSGRALGTKDLAIFIVGVSLLAIFFDASLGHSLTWENDPYWTYWITKTFLIATVFGLGTAWFGVGLGRGAVITAVHTLVLTIYYWTFSPIGLPSAPEWLDLEHTWVSGLPIHFAVIYLGYVVTLWLWHRPTRLGEGDSARVLGWRALIVSVVVVVFAGGLSSLALGDFPGATWFLVRLLITIPFLIIWWAAAGSDGPGVFLGAVMLSLIWATYGHFLGPVGLPDTPLRILDSNPPPATVEFLDYRQLWLVSFPIYLLVAAVALYFGAPKRNRRRGLRANPSLVVILPLFLILTAASAGSLGQTGSTATVNSSGPVHIMNVVSGEMFEGSGDISVTAVDMGGRVTPLPPNDRLSIDATIDGPTGVIEVMVREAMIEHPLGSYTTWWGVGLDVTHHGNSGIGTSTLPYITSELAAFGLGSVSVDGTSVASNVPIHVMTASTGLPDNARLALDLVPEGFEAIPGIPGGQLMVLWMDYQANIDKPHTLRYAIGGVVTIALLATMIYLVRREDETTHGAAI